MNPAAPRVEEESFLAVRSIKRKLLSELTEPSGPSEADLNDLLGRWPTEPIGDADVAGLLFQEFRNRSQRGLPISRDTYEKEFPEHRDSLASLFRQQDLLGSLHSASAPLPPTFALPKVGDELFGYRLRQQLGQGAFARVFLAEQSELAGRLVALKTSDLTGSEPQTLAQLQHTNIVPIYSVHEDTSAGIRAVCMPYFGGTSLSQILQAVWEKSDHPESGTELVAALTGKTESGIGTLSNATTSPLDATIIEACINAASEIDQWPDANLSSVPVEHEKAENGGSNRSQNVEAIRVALAPQLLHLKELDFPQACAWLIARLAEGLQHAHDRGVLHRDIKPANILVGGDGTPMLLDFNLAHDGNQTQAEVTLGGTVAYMAPEHLQALIRRTPALIKQVDERSDLYGLGMVFFEMITGHNPFELSISGSMMPIMVEAMAKERSRTTPSLRQHRPDVSWGLESIVRKCLQPDATQRYQRAADLAEDLDCWLEDRSLRHAPELSRIEQIQKWTRRHPKLASSGLIAIAASLLLTLGGLLLLGTQARLMAAQTRVRETEGAAARELLHKFDEGTLKALCLVNTYSDLRDHAEQGRQVCEETLSLFGILDDPNWQDLPAWKRLSVSEQRKLAEDARELLVLLAGNADASRVGRMRDASATLLDRAESIRGLPPSAAVWRARAALFMQLGDIERAKIANLRADELPPTTARDFYLLATTHLQSAEPNRYERAIHELREALKRDPRHYWSWMQKGLCHLEQHEPQLALADFGVCVGLWPEFAWGYFNRAFALDQLGQKEASIADYSAALERDHELLAALQNRSMAWLELGQPANALTDVNRLLAAKSSPDPVLFALRGQALAGLNRDEEADQAFAQALSAEQFEELPAATQNQLLCSFAFAVSARRPDDAEKAFARIPSDDPKYPEALYGRGLIAANRNRPERAAELFGLALDRRPNFGEARRFRAILLARLSRIAEAINEINTALQAAPNSGATLYAAACVTALAAEQAPTLTAARQAADEAMRFLKQARVRGYGAHAATDEDLKAIRQHPEFDQQLFKSF